MDKTFASVLRHSRLASFDKTIRQVYKTSKKNQRRGDWGLKRNLPTVIRTPNVTVKALDTAEHQTPWDSGENQVMFVKRWKENFPRSSVPVGRSEALEHHIATMTPAEFNLFLKKVEKQADEFEGLVKSKALSKEQVFEFLKVNVSGERAPGDGVVGPTYSDHPVEMDYPVRGRILNAVRRTEGHSVGIGGVVAHLPRRYTPGMSSNVGRNILSFYVQQAEIDEEGRPQVTVALRAKGAFSSVPLLQGDSDYYERSQDREGRRMSALDMWDVKSGKSRLRPSTNPMEENTQPNPKHVNLMARISNLLETSTKKSK